LWRGSLAVRQARAIRMFSCGWRKYSFRAFNIVTASFSFLLLNLVCLRVTMSLMRHPGFAPFPV
jgi:hypothetical protein